MLGLSLSHKILKIPLCNSVSILVSFYAFLIFFFWKSHEVGYIAVSHQLQYT